MSERAFRVLPRKNASDVRSPLAPLFALSTAIFIASTTEFLPGGLIPYIARDLGLTPQVVGQTVTVFALVVILTAVPLTIITRKFERKRLILTGFLAICISNLAVALAPSFELILVARGAGALAHALFWSVVLAYTAEIVPAHLLGRALAIIGAGASMSSIIGGPVGNALGQAMGWRMSFVAVGAVGLVLAFILQLWLPKRPGGMSLPKTSKIKVPKKGLPALLFLCSVIVVVVLGYIAFGTYSTVWLLDVARFEDSQLPLYLLFSGIAGAMGALVAGPMIDRYPRGFVVGLSVAVIAALVLFTVSAPYGYGPAVFLTGMLSAFAFAGVPMALQTRILKDAPPALRGTAGALQTIAFNVGIGSGSLIGGIAISRLGLPALPLVAAAVFSIGTLLLIVSMFTRRRSTHDLAEPPT